MVVLKTQDISIRQAKYPNMIKSERKKKRGILGVLIESENEKPHIVLLTVDENERRSLISINLQNEIRKAKRKVKETAREEVNHQRARKIKQEIHQQIKIQRK